MISAVLQAVGPSSRTSSTPHEGVHPSRVGWLGRWSRRCCPLFVCAALASVGPGCQRTNAVDTVLLSVSPADGELDRLAISVANHCGVTMTRYHCSFHEYPLQLRAWWEVAFAGREPAKVGIVWLDRGV
jgi:hypothetical protein